MHDNASALMKLLDCQGEPVATGKTLICTLIRSRTNIFACSSLVASIAAARAPPMLHRGGGCQVPNFGG